jgi:hypothetical protein
MPIGSRIVKRSDPEGISTHHWYGVAATTRRSEKTQNPLARAVREGTPRQNIELRRNRLTTQLREFVIGNSTRPLRPARVDRPAAGIAIAATPMKRFMTRPPKQKLLAQ